MSGRGRYRAAAIKILRDTRRRRRRRRRRQHLAIDRSTRADPISKLNRVSTLNRDRGAGTKTRWQSVCVGGLRINARYRGSPVGNRKNTTSRLSPSLRGRRFPFPSYDVDDGDGEVSRGRFSNRNRRRWRAAAQSNLRRYDVSRAGDFASPGSADSVRETVLQWIVKPSTIIGSISNKTRQTRRGLRAAPFK